MGSSPKSVMAQGEPAKRAIDESPWRKPWVSVASARSAREAGERSKPAPAICRWPKGFCLRHNAVDAAPPRCAQTANAVGLTVSPASRASAPYRFAPHGLRHGLSSIARFAGSWILGLPPSHFWERSLFFMMCEEGGQLPRHAKRRRIERPVRPLSPGKGRPAKPRRPGARTRAGPRWFQL